MYALKCRGILKQTDEPLIMGIVNVTPDSFFAKSRSNSIEMAVNVATQMLQNGADILDIGGQSTRPGSERISAQEEIDRTAGVISAIHQQHKAAIISIDTYSAKVAEVAINEGAHIVNDISGGEMDSHMLETVATLKAPFVCTHMQGTPDNMQTNPVYDNVTLSVLDFFIRKKAECLKAGIKDIIIDPGFGFGKTLEHNYALLKNLSDFKLLDCPVLAGVSRKSMIGKLLNLSAKEALNGTSVLHTLALLNGANILRVHDVKEAVEVRTILKQYKEVGS